MTGRRRARAHLRGGLAVVAVALLAAAPVAAQDDPVAPPTLPLPPPPPPPATVPVPDPTTTTLVPEPDPLPDPADVRTARTEGERVAYGIRQRVRDAWQARVDAAGDTSGAARDQVDALTATYLGESASVADRGHDFDEAQVAYRAVVDSYRDARAAYTERLTLAYVSGPVTQLNEILRADRPLEATRRLQVLRSALDDAQRTVADRYLRAASLDPAFDVEAEGLAEARDDLAELRVVRGVAQERLAAANERLTDEASLADDVLFPVAGDHEFTDSFLAPRTVAGRFHHRHQGADIFAASGTPLVAVERGVLFRLGEGTLGGIKLWLLGESGTAYYYAHLSSFAEAAREGAFVEAGTVIGYVGDTGNARGTPPHLHFEVRPGGGSAVNPTPLLDQLAERDGR